jgi:hypothetical protein
MEGSVRDAADNGAPLAHDRDGAMTPVQHEARYVFARHVGQLPREDVLQRDQPVATQRSHVHALATALAALAHHRAMTL